ncbi:MAG: ABC transporter ATP-binding protein [Proteobacteria bacterium]|nr:ABC transporter ATP-binding protein [Pseudomonadota bacterium]
MLEARSLTKLYGTHKALDHLELIVKEGEVFCLLGANGAGKTTTINLFLDFIQPSSGQAMVGGKNAREPESKHLLAYIPETVMLYSSLTGIENLNYFSRLAIGREHRKEDLSSLLIRAGLPAEAATKPVSSYSKGMRQKVGIAIAMAKGARALLLDEPTSGLDPQAANEFATLMEAQRALGAAVLMTTHDLFLAKQVGTRVGIMRQGRLLSCFATAGVDHVELERMYLNTIGGGMKP